MPVNNFLPFCPTDTGTNLLSQPDYSVATDRDVGNQPGVASSKLVNKSIRQATFITSQIAQFISDQTGQDVVDDANTAALLAQINLAFGTTSSRTVTFAAGTKTLAATDGIVYLGTSGGAYTFTIPAASTSNKNKIYRLQKTTADFNPVTLAGGFSGYINTIGETIELINNGTTWRLLSRSGVTGVLVSTVVPVIISGSATDPTKGTGGVETMAWYRNGSKCQGYWNFSQTVAGTPGTSGQPYLISAVPPGSGLIVDTTNFTPGSASSDDQRGQCGGNGFADNNTTWTPYTCLYADTGTGKTGIQWMRDGANAWGEELRFDNSLAKFSGNWEVPVVNW